MLIYFGGGGITTTKEKERGDAERVCNGIAVMMSFWHIRLNQYEQRARFDALVENRKDQNDC